MINLTPHHAVAELLRLFSLAELRLTRLWLCALAVDVVGCHVLGDAPDSVTIICHITSVTSFLGTKSQHTNFTSQKLYDPITVAFMFV
jgi:hypothetical protein